MKIQTIIEKSLNQLNENQHRILTISDDQATILQTTITNFKHTLSDLKTTEINFNHNIEKINQLHKNISIQVL